MINRGIVVASSWRRPWFQWVLAIVVVVSVSAPVAVAGSADNLSVEKLEAKLAKYPHQAGEVVVRLKTVKGLRSLEQRFGAKASAIRPFETDAQFVKLVLNNKSNMAQAIVELNQLPEVAYAEPNYLYRISTDDVPQEITPNDPSFTQLWGMKNTGQNDAAGQVGVAGADIAATRAWAIARGSDEIKVAVIDTGVDYNHPDLAANIYINPGESCAGCESNGIDDDANGFIDDVRGWNFAGRSTNNPMDDHAHGTHCAGTIGARGDDGLGVVGVAWNVKIVPIKFLSASGSGTLEDAVKSIQYATIMNVHMMSNSWGGGPYTQAMYDSILAAKEKGILFIAAAGNDGDNADTTPHYPAGYQIDNVLAVAATDNRDQLASFSTYGKRTVHIAAPGVKILSTVLNGRYAAYSGTSMATPHVAGAAAVVWGNAMNLNYADIRARIINSRDPKAALARKVGSGGRLNLYNALTETYPPSGEPDESAWLPGEAMEPIETAHPYADNARQEWVIRGPANAKFMRVNFSRIELESNYDFVRVISSSGEEVDAITGTQASGYTSWYVPGNEIRIRFTSDSSVTKWGFRADSYQFIPE